MSKKPKTPAPALPSFMTSTIIMIALVGGLGLFSYYSGWLEPGVHIALNVPETIAHTPGVILLPIELHVSNPADTPQSLTVSSSCNIFRWAVITPSGTLIKASPRQSCAEGSFARALEPHEDIVETESLALPAERFVPEETYRLWVRFWGVERQALFTISKSP